MFLEQKEPEATAVQQFLDAVRTHLKWPTFQHGKSESQQYLSFRLVSIDFDETLRGFEVCGEIVWLADAFAIEP